MGNRGLKLAFAWRVACGSVAFWGVLSLIASLFDPRWPSSFAANRPTESAWVGVVLVAFLVEALGVKIVTMWRSTRVLDRLGAGVLVANAGFWIAYAATLILSFWPGLGRNEWVRRALLAELAVTVGYGTFEILRFVASTEPPRPRLTRVMTVGAVGVVLAVLWRFGWL